MDDLDLGWFVAMAEQREGPMTRRDVELFFFSGRADPETLVWHHSLVDWTPAKNVPLFNGTLSRHDPPPLPKARDRPEELKSWMEEGPKDVHRSGPSEQELSRLAPDPADLTPQTEGQSPSLSTGLGRKTVFGLYAMAGLSAIAALSSYGEYYFIQEVMAGGPFSEERAEAIDDRQQLMGSLWFIGFLIVGIIFIRWSQSQS